MAIYTRRVQTVLSDEQFKLLTDLSQELDKPVSVLIREAVDKTYLADVERRQRQAALQTLLSLDAPVADWPQMEDEIIKGATE
jgi:hypothetical protein